MSQERDPAPRASGRLKAALATFGKGPAIAVAAAILGTWAITATFTSTAPGTRIVNFSTRGPVLTADNVKIVGFAIEGKAQQTVLITVRGPSMATPPANLQGSLPDPFLQLFSGQTQIAVNDDWGTNANAADITATGLAPPHAKEAALLVTLDPGPYTAIVTGVGGTAGIAMVEVFAR